MNSKQYPPELVFHTTPAERKLLLRLRQLKAGSYLAMVTTGGDEIELVLVNDKPLKKERMR